MEINKLRLALILGLISIIAISCASSSKINGKTSPILDANNIELPNSITEITKVEIGGIDQYMIIRGVDTAKPVILYLHGGPGDAEISLMREFNPLLENDFLMVYWEQRGACKSYSKHIPAESMNIEQFISDTKDVSEYLINRFNKEKIYIMGHSWGTFLGILTIYKYPELYHAYFGVGQVCMQYESEKLSLEWIKEQAESKNDKKSINKISKLQLPDESASGKEWIQYLIKQREYVRIYGGGPLSYSGLTKKSSFANIIFSAKEYSFSDKLGYIKGSTFSVEHLWPSMIEKDLSQEIDSIQVPVFIFQGKYDYQTSTEITKQFFSKLKAPEKELFIFDNSSHSPMMEEPKKFNEIILGKIKLHL